MLFARTCFVISDVSRYLYQSRAGRISGWKEAARIHTASNQRSPVAAATAALAGLHRDF